MKIKLGDKVRCKHTGFVGVAVARIEYINGCVQFAVIPKAVKNTYPSEKEEACIDETSLVVVSKTKKTVKKKKKSPGGPTTISARMRGY